MAFPKEPVRQLDLVAANIVPPTSTCFDQYVAYDARYLDQQLPIDLPTAACGDDDLRPLVTKGDILAMLLAIFGTIAGGTLVLWVFG